MEPDFYDIRIVNARASSIVLDNDEIKETSNSFITGASIRALVGGTWGLVTTENLDEIREACKQAARLAQAAGERSTRDRIELAPIKKPVVKDLPEIKENPENIDIEEKLQLVRDISKSAQKPRITSVHTVYSESEVSVEYRNSDGVEAGYTLPRIGFSITAVAQENGNYQAARESCFAISGFELFKRKDPLAIASKTADTATDLLRAKSVWGGVMPVILDPELAGVFIHEAVGHAAEADHVLEGNSVFEGRLNTTIGSPLVTVHDDPTLHEYGYYPFDDEGAEPKKTVVIENGVLKNYLHNRETAGRLAELRPADFQIAKQAGRLDGVSCNARAQGYSRPIVRMSNTYIDNGSSTFEEMLEEVKDGVYLIGSRGGQVDPGDGIFQFNAERGYLIENHELKALIKDVSLSGNILEILSEITAVGSDLKMHPGQCGKAGQTVPVSDGSPHILVKKALVGGSG